MRPRSFVRRNWAPIAAVGLALLLIVPGYVVGASLKITKGTVEQGRGMFITGNSIGTWWIPSKFVVTQVPTTVPPTLSAVAGAPTVLSNSSEALLDVVGSSAESALLWQITVGTGAPLSTEVELTFNISLGTVPPSQLKVYLETNSSAPSLSVTYRFYFPFNTPAPTAVALQIMTIEAEPCASVGSCP